MAGPSEDDILAKRKEVIGLAKEDDLRYMKTQISRYDLRIMELKYEMEHGERVPMTEDDEWRYLYEREHDTRRKQ